MQATLCILLTRDESIGSWTAHCLELDVVSQGPTIPTAITAAIEAVEMVIKDDCDNGLDPLDRSVAPQEYWHELLDANKNATSHTRTFTISIEIPRPMIKKQDTVGVLETSLELPIRYVIHSDATFPFKISIFCDRLSEDAGKNIHRQIPIATWIPERGLSMVSFAYMIIQEAGLVPQVREFCEQSYAAYSEEQS